jgi:hypothetical protein
MRQVDDLISPQATGKEQEPQQSSKTRTARNCPQSSFGIESDRAPAAGSGSPGSSYIAGLAYEAIARSGSEMLDCPMAGRATRRSSYNLNFRKCFLKSVMSRRRKAPHPTH